MALAFATDAEPVRTNALTPARQPIDTDALARRMVAGSVRMLEAKEHIFRDGDPVTHVYWVEVGHVCIYKLLSDGRRQVIDFAYPGDLIGLGALGEHAANAQASTRTRVRCLPIAALHQVVRDNVGLGIELYEAMSRELTAARELLFTVSQRTAVERIAGFLLALSKRNARRGDKPDEFVLPMTRSDIADFLGLTIETVSRTFTRLRSEGVIDLKQSVLVTIVDNAALEGLAEGSLH